MGFSFWYIVGLELKFMMIFAFVLLLIAVASTQECGKPEVQGIRVIAGKTAVRGSWPWQILMKFGGRAGCGGTLIAPQWVVTAAHCVYRREAYPWMFSVVVGEHDRQVREGSEQEIRVQRVYRHPGYDPRRLNNDIAMFKLSKPAQMGKYVKTACLPSVDPPVGSKCYITGWGKTHHPGSMTRTLQQGFTPPPINTTHHTTTSASLILTHHHTYTQSTHPSTPPTTLQHQPHSYSHTITHTHSPHIHQHHPHTASTTSYILTHTIKNKHLINTISYH